MKTRLISATLILSAALAAPTVLAHHTYGSKWRSASVQRTVSDGGYVYRTASRSAGEYDYADVLHVEPIVRLVRTEVPREACWDEEVYRRNRGRDGTAGATIAGGLIGGVIGRQFGSGDGRDAMTVIGTLVGSAVANESARNRTGRVDGYYDTVRRCETRYDVIEKERIEGYRVTYLYNGREYTTRTESDPGDRIRVRVTVSPTARR